MTKDLRDDEQYVGVRMKVKKVTTKHGTNEYWRQRCEDVTDRYWKDHSTYTTLRSEIATLNQEIADLKRAPAPEPKDYEFTTEMSREELAIDNERLRAHIRGFYDENRRLIPPRWVAPGKTFAKSLGWWREKTDAAEEETP